MKPPFLREQKAWVHNPLFRHPHFLHLIQNMQKLDLGLDEFFSHHFQSLAYLLSVAVFVRIIGKTFHVFQDGGIGKKSELAVASVAQSIAKLVDGGRSFLAKLAGRCLGDHRLRISKCRQHFSHHLTNLGRFQPASNNHQVMCPIHDNEISPKSSGIEDRLWHSFPIAGAFFFIEPPHIAVIGIGLRRDSSRFDPGGIEEFLVFPHTMIQKQHPKACMIFGADEDASPPNGPRR